MNESNAVDLPRAEDLHVDKHLLPIRKIMLLIEDR